MSLLCKGMANHYMPVEHQLHFSNLQHMRTPSFIKVGVGECDSKFANGMRNFASTRKNKIDDPLIATHAALLTGPEGCVLAD